MPSESRLSEVVSHDAWTAQLKKMNNLLNLPCLHSSYEYRTDSIATLYFYDIKCCSQFEHVTHITLV